MIRPLRQVAAPRVKSAASVSVSHFVAIIIILKVAT